MEELTDRLVDMAIRATTLGPYEVIDESIMKTLTGAQLLDFMNYWNEMGKADPQGPERQRSVIRQWIASLLQARYGEWDKGWEQERWISFLKEAGAMRRRFVTYDNIHVLKDIIRHLIEGNTEAQATYKVFLDEASDIEQVRAELGGLLFQCYSAELAAGKNTPNPLEWVEYIGDVRNYQHDIVQGQGGDS